MIAINYWVEFLNSATEVEVFFTVMPLDLIINGKD